MDFHAVQMCEWLGVLYQSLLDSLAQHNWGEAAGKELRPLFLFRYPTYFSPMDFHAVLCAMAWSSVSVIT